MNETGGRPPAEGVSICIGCGMCCDGTLHGNTRVKQDDEAAVAAVGLAVEQEDGKRLFRQPCPHFVSGGCGVYSRRPPVCRTYRCALLIDVDEGRIAPDEAREKITQAKMLVKAVKDANPEISVPSDRARVEEALKARLEHSNPAERAQIGQRLLALGALHHFLLRWFHKKNDEQQAPRAEKVEALAQSMEPKDA